MTLPKLFAEEDEPHLPPEKGVIVVLGVASLFLGLFAPLMRSLTEGQVPGSYLIYAAVFLLVLALLASRGRQNALGVLALTNLLGLALGFGLTFGVIALGSGSTTAWLVSAKWLLGSIGLGYLLKRSLKQAFTPIDYSHLAPDLEAFNSLPEQERPAYVRGQLSAIEAEIESLTQQQERSWRRIRILLPLAVLLLILSFIYR
ncbi:MAG: hypothetical protein J0H02_02885 [Armatimonadetes bacterium]|nr:hypothetical protein [Armatimonadota bacterium]